MKTCRTVLILFALLASLRLSGAEQKIESYPPEYRAGLAEMAKAFTARDFPATLEAIEKLEKVAPPNAHTVNTRAAVMIEQHQYDEGRRLCLEALKLDPKYYPAKFNLGEIPLMEGKYPEARAIFQTLFNANPRDELAQFRIYLTFLLEKNDAAAREVLGRFKFPSDTPAFYYANAAWEFTRGNKDEGKAWVDRGNWVFGKDKAQNFAESLIQQGWIEREAPPQKTPATSTTEVTAPPAKAELAKPQLELAVPNPPPTLGRGAPATLDDPKPEKK
jgi:tetratricopeptide (TPR) repeat protein